VFQQKQQASLPLPDLTHSKCFLQWQNWNQLFIHLWSE